MMLECSDSEDPRLISHEIIFEVFRPMWWNHRTSTSRTDGQTDRRTDNLP